MTRNQLIDEIEEIRNDRKYDKFIGRIDGILDAHGASQDDSDPDEGFYITMDTRDIAAAFNEIHKLISTVTEQEDDFRNIIDGIKNLGFHEAYASSNEGDVVYYVKDDLGIIICDAEEARRIAYSFL